MKKKTGRLRLAKETLRALRPAELEEVAGGGLVALARRAPQSNGYSYCPICTNGSLACPVA